jgi:hypothetical protein
MPIVHTHVLDASQASLIDDAIEREAPEPQLRQFQRNLGRVFINRVYPPPIPVLPGYTLQSGGRAALLSSSCFLHPSPSQCDQ